MYGRICPKTEGDWELLEADVPLYLGYSSSEVVVLYGIPAKSKVLFDDLTINDAGIRSF